MIPRTHNGKGWNGYRTVFRNWATSMDTMKLDYLSPYKKINCKWTKSLSTRLRTTKQRESFRTLTGNTFSVVEPKQRDLENDACPPGSPLAASPFPGCPISELQVLQQTLCPQSQPRVPERLCSLHIIPHFLLCLQPSKFWPPSTPLSKQVDE